MDTPTEDIGAMEQVYGAVRRRHGDPDHRLVTPGRPMRRITTACAVALGALSGCVTSAPSFTIFGAYFPAWLLCALIGLLAAIGSRVAFVTVAKADVLPFQLFVCTSIGVSTALLTWLFWFGR